MLDKLCQLFENKQVRITTPEGRTKRAEGICRTVHEERPGDFDLELDNGNRFGFTPEKVTETSVEGKMSTNKEKARTIELI